MKLTAIAIVKYNGPDAGMSRHNSMRRSLWGKTGSHGRQRRVAVLSQVHLGNTGPPPSGPRRNAHWRSPRADPYILSFASDLSSFGFFQRSSVKEFLIFTTRTVSRKTSVGQRQTVQQDEYFCHAYNRDGLVGIAFADREYPVRAGFSVVNKVLDDFESRHGGDRWRGALSDTFTEEDPELQGALQRYQDPLQADKLTKIQQDLDETKIILHKTIESVLDRGEKLDNLVDKSNDLSMASQMFYKQARKTNSCCNFM
jgi:synaptobrevin family protein YKT6